MSMPGTDEDKRPLIECMSCHTLERIVKSKYTSDEFIGVLSRMANYANNSTQARIQLRHQQRDVPENRLRKVADYLSSLNLSTGPWKWSLKTLPRPKGRATKVIITEYDMPRKTIAPHDVRVDPDGYVWYSNFVEPYLGRLDPRSGEHKEFAYPLLKPDFPTGSLDLEPDADGNLWLALMFQAGIAKFDKKSESFRMFPVTPDFNNDAMQQSMVMPWNTGVDGKVWTNDVAKQSIMRVDVATGKYEFLDPFKNVPKGPAHAPYGLASDAANNLWFMDFGDENIGKVDAKTMAPTLYPTPTRGSRPRRMMSDGRRLWFAEFAANKLGMFDMARESYKEWNAPTPHSYPYDAFMDRAGDLWSGNMSNDRVLRMKPDASDAVEYLLPRPTNIRRIFVDNSTPRPTFWAGNNHGASIIKLEPLD
jgi:virginiamycin B lyase